MEPKKRKVYQARFKRIFFTTFIAIFLVVMLGVVLYFTYNAQYEIGIWVGIATSVVLLSLVSAAIREASIAIQRRGYSRPIGTKGFERVVKSIFPTDPQKQHPAQYQRSVKTVHFDGGQPYQVDLGVLYFVLIREVHYPSILTWDRCVVKEGMSKDAHAAYRKLLQDAGVVDVDGRGAMVLNCGTVAAIETIKERC